MRHALIISVAGHAAIVLCGLMAFARPTLFESLPVQSITVDLVSPSEAAASSEEQTPQSQVSPDERATKLASDAAAHGSDRSQTPTGLESGSPSSQVSQSGPATEPTQPKANEFVFNLATVGGPISSLLDHENENRGDGFDAPADRSAALSSEAIATFKNQLKKCWNPPADVAGAPKTTVVLRVALSPDGGLRAKPQLLEASASPRGLALVQTAMRALSQCQPYSFLGPEKYSEWKLLDLRFSPDGLSGG